MKNFSKSKKLLSFILALFLFATVFSISMISASALTTSSEWFLRGSEHSDPRNEEPYEIHFRNTTKVLSITGIMVVHCINNKLAYCVQPGVEISSTLNEGKVDDLTFLSSEQRDMLKIVLAIGYSSSADPASWGNKYLINKNTLSKMRMLNQSYREAFCRANATQMLIWEVVTGERTSSFDKAYKDIQFENYFRESAYWGDIYKYHEEYVREIKEQLAIKNATDTHTQLGTENRTFNPKNENGTKVDLGTIELELKPNLMVEGSITDTRISDLVVGTTLTPTSKKLNFSAFPAGTVKLEGNKISVSMTVKQALDYMDKTYNGKITKTSTKYTKGTEYLASSESKQYKTCNNWDTVAATGSGQNMVYLIQGRTTYITKTINHYEQPNYFDTFEYEYSFKIHVPLLHVHKWIPHRITPTCTTQGLMCWECSCGKVITADYGFTSGTATFVGEAGAIDPKKYDFTTGIVKADGHGKGEWITTVAPTCTTDGVEQKICEKCGVVLESRTLNATGHTSGDDSILVQTVAPSRTSKGEYQIRCGKCGVVQGTKEIPMHDHNSKGGKITATPATCYSEGSKGTVCSECGVIWKTEKVPAGHSKETVTITTKPATCTENGEAKMLCTDCGMMISAIVLPKLGHTDEDVWFTQTESTCEQDGESAKLCTRCGKITDTKKINALGHDEGVWTTTIEPTCELDGEKVLTCTRCGNINESKSIDKLNHDDGYWKIDVEATPDHNGIKSLYCSRCQVLKESEEFTLHTHEDGYEIVTLKPTCTADGQKGTVCKICNTCFKTETVKSEGHKFNDTFTNGDGTHSKRCKICGYESKENCDIKSVTKANDCFDIGYTTNECEICSYNYVSGIKEAKGHNYNKWEDFNNTTHVRYCKNCPVAEYTLHQFDEYVSDNNASGSNPGTKTRTCIYCAKKETVKAESTCITVIAKVSEKTFSLTLLFLELFFLVLDFAEKTGLVHFKKG